MKDRGIELGAEAIEAIARRVAQLLGADLGPERLIDAAALAERLGVDREWVYAHAVELGAIRLGGPNGRLRFDMRRVKERLEGEEPRRWQPVHRASGSAQRRDGKRRQPPPPGRIKSPQIQRGASGWTPAPSPKQQHPGGSPNAEA
jgi:hypothetical protein